MSFNPLHIIDELNNAIGHGTASVLEFLHITDPAVNPSGVRQVAHKWQAMATAVRDADRQAQSALHGVVWQGAAAAAFAARTKKVHGEAGKIAKALDQGSGAINKFANEADDLIAQIGNICAQIEEMEVAGLALDILTEGFSSCAATIMAGERATQIVSLIAKLEESGTVLGNIIKTVSETIRTIEKVIEALKDIKGVATVAKWAGEGMKFGALGAALQDPSVFLHPSKLAETLAEGALMGVAFGGVGKALGKTFETLSPAAMRALSKSLCKLDDLIPEGSKLRPGEDDKIRSSIANALKKFKQDPIDVVTGEMMIAQTDAELPGVLPLLLERTHLSAYRTGGWFGRSWASTLDQRLQLDAEGVVLATADGLRLCYPRPQPGVPAFPERGPRWPLEWDGRPGSRIRITDPVTGRTVVFAHPTDAGADGLLDLPLQAVEDRNGNWIRVHHSIAGVPVEIEHHGGYRVAIDCHPDRPRITAYRLLDADGPGTSTPLMRFGYDETGNLTEVVNSSGLPLRYTYDIAGRITSWTDRNNTSYHYTYDSDGRCLRGEGIDGFQSGTFVYDTANRTTRVTNSLGHTTTVEYNAAYRPIRETDPLGNTTVTEWDADNERVTAVTDPLGRTTRYEYDEAGNVTAIEQPDGTAVTAAYNELNLPLGITGPDGSVRRYTYDSGGNRLSATEPDGARTRYTYDTAGGLVTVVDALGHTWRIANNPACLPVALTDPLGHRTIVERDPFGRLAAFTDALENITRLGWSVEGKPLWRERSGGTRESWQWDGEGNLTAYADPTGNTTAYQVGPFDVEVSRTSPDGTTHSFEYDGELNLTRVTNSQGLSWKYEYDSTGRRTSETDFDGRTLHYTHDAAGQLTTRTNALGQTITYGRDVLGQVLTKDADGLITTYAYDSASRLVRATGPDGIITYRRDTLGRVQSQTCNDRTITFTYDFLGNLTSRTTPAGHTSTWTYDSAGRPTALAAGGHTLEFQYDPVGREITRRLGKALTLTQAWDHGDRLTTQTLTGPDTRTIQHRAHTYRADDYLTAIDDQLNGPRTYDLDAAGRVTSVQAGDWAERYTYDEAGNQTTAQWPPTHADPEAVGARAYNGTRITRAGAIRYEHDAQGRIVLRQKSRLSRKPDTWRYEWDAEDRLTAVTTPDGTVWRYRYDPFGRRTAKQRLGDDGTVLEQTDFVWDGTTLAEQATTTAALSDPVTLTWDHAGLRPIAQTERISATDAPQADIDHRFYAIITDLVGTPTELVDEEGEVTWRRRSTLWGATASVANGSAHTPLRFPGQYFDPESGLHYNVHRYYEPATGRYVTADPLGLDPAPNPRGYVDNPHHETDPLGLMACGTDGKLSDPLPRGMNNKIASVYDDVKAGRLTSHDTYKGREHPWWAGAKEYRVPGRPETDRILEKELPNGTKVYGWTSTHYQKIQRFNAPHFPDSGWNY